MKNIYKYAIFAITIIALSSCSLRNDYPVISYYKLDSQPTSKINNASDIQASIMIRDVMVSTGNETDQIMATNDDGSIKKYFYHRWISDIPSLVTDFFRERYTKLGLFKEGIIKSASATVPNYILEVSLIEFSAFNTAKGSPYVEVTAVASIIEYPKLSGGELQKVFTKKFTSKEYRQNTEVGNIAPAYSKALNTIADDIYLELFNFINQHHTELKK